MGARAKVPSPQRRRRQGAQPTMLIGSDLGRPTPWEPRQGGQQGPETYPPCSSGRPLGTCGSSTCPCPDLETSPTSRCLPYLVQRAG